MSMQQRALVEPRVRVMCVLFAYPLPFVYTYSVFRPKKRKIKIKDYELHTFKDFDSKKTYF